ncbi:MAG: cupin, partial [Candidatus Eremiobacteraeota bacterium]|nr:cupin [Candidatus Eremiobacteraeota bacterium]
MKIINTNELADETWASPDGRYVFAGKEISEALGRVPQSTDPRERQPFDVEIQR